MLNAHHSAHRYEHGDRMPTVLVVDDSASIRKLVELTLRRDGYTVASVSSGIAALAAVAERRPDLILLDVMLDALDGFQITRALRANPEFADIPIVVLSGREGEADQEAGFLAGVSDYLTKPFHPERLTHVVRQQLHSHASVGVSQLVVA